MWWRLLTGGLISDVIDGLGAAWQAKLRADTNEKRLAAEVTINQRQAQLEVLLSEQKRLITAWIRPALALPVVIFVWKIIVWDTVLELGVTRSPGSLVEWIVGITIGFYFLTRPFEFRK